VIEGFAIYLLLVVGVLLWRSRALRGPWWFLLRSFFPNWKFYDVVGHLPRVWLSWQDASGQWSEPELWWPRQPMRWWRLFHNPQGNALLARQNLIDHWASDLAGSSVSSPQAAEVSGALVRRHLSHDLQQREPQAQAFRYVLRMEHPQHLGPDAVLQVWQSEVIPMERP
jgi:hypothetical protein